VTEPRIRVAIVGLGIGRMHVLAFAELRAMYQVVAVCDTDADRAAEVAGWLKDVRAVTDPEEIWAADDVDVVSICTPPALHRAQVEAALRAGKDVICEKPLVGSVSQVDELAALEVETGHHVMPVFQYRFGNGLQKLKWLVDQDVTGRPFVANVDMAWLRGADYYATEWRGRWETELGGVVLTHAVHALDMLMQILGPPSAVWARLATLVNDIETEDSAAITLRWSYGGLATVSATLGSAQEITRHRFTFEHLSAESGTDPYYSSFEPWTFTPTEDHAEEIEAALDQFVPGKEDYIGQFDRYADARAKGTPPPVLLADARQALELVTALYLSDRQHREVSLPLPADEPALNGWEP